MDKFIEVSNKKGENVLLNVSHIFEVSEEKGNAIIKLNVSGYNQFPYYYVETDMPYNTVRQIIDDSLG